MVYPATPTSETYTHYYWIIAVTVPTPTPTPSYAMPILTTPICKVPEL